LCYEEDVILERQTPQGKIIIDGDQVKRLLAKSGGITADIVILRREYFQKIKGKLLSIALGLGKGSWIKNLIALITAVNLIKKYPELDRKNIGNKNTLAFLDIAEKFNKYHNNGNRQPLFDHFYHLAFGTTAHDKYYGSIADWWIEEIIKAILDGKIDPRPEGWLKPQWWKEPQPYGGEYIVIHKMIKHRDEIRKILMA